MKALYGHVDNIDLWVGGLAEQHDAGSELGQTFSTLVSRVDQGSVYGGFQPLEENDKFKIYSMLIIA